MLIINKTIKKWMKHLYVKYPKLIFPLYANYIYYFTNCKCELHLIPQLCEKDKNSIDVGANIGLHSYFMNKNSSICYSFEPQENLCKKLKKIFPKNQVYCSALSSKEGVTTMYIPHANGIDDHESATIEPSNISIQDPDRVKKIEITLKSMDNYDFSNIGFIKIDCEGHEMEVLKGGIKTIKKYLPNLMIEIEEKHKPGNLLCVSKLLDNLNYEMFYYINGNLLNLNSHQICLLAEENNVIDGNFVNNFIFKQRN